MARRTIFLDTAYINGLVNSRDQWHSKALEWQTRLAHEKPLLLTTQLILVEIGNGLSAIRFRQKAGHIIRFLSNSSHVEIVNLNSQSFESALELYEKRDDKGWGLTDCFSFVTMTSKGVNDALTTDDHFTQAGFNALLLH